MYLYVKRINVPWENENNLDEAGLKLNLISSLEVDFFVDSKNINTVEHEFYGKNRRGPNFR